MGPPVDSKDGIADLLEWARLGGFVLNDYHKRIAERWGVDTAGVVFAGRIPTHPIRPTSTTEGNR